MRRLTPDAVYLLNILGGTHEPVELERSPFETLLMSLLAQLDHVFLMEALGEGVREGLLTVERRHRFLRLADLCESFKLHQLIIQPVEEVQRSLVLSLRTLVQLRRHGVE